MGADTGGRAVDGGDDRLLAVEHGSDQSLRSVGEHSHDGAGRWLAVPIGLGRVHLGLRGSQVGTGTEVSAVGADDHGPNGRVEVDLVQQVDDRVALVGGDGIARIGAVEGDPGDRVFYAVEEGAVFEAG